MRYLKRFNESLSSSQKDELQDFCNNSLIYLLDEGYDVDIVDETGYGHFQTVVFCLPGPNDSEDFYWENVKDYYIPFLQLLSRRYKIGHKPYSFDPDSLSMISSKGPGSVSFFADDLTTIYTLDQVVNDEIDVDNIPFFGIKVDILGKL